MYVMTKIDLVTGFLGSGKTTFLKLYARYLMDKGENIGILENDYGAVNVDMMLLNELEGDNCELEMVASACHNDCHKRRFKSKLISMGMCGYTRVIVEPSGIFDVDEFFDVMREDPINRMYTVDNVIAVVDARLEDEMSDLSDYYLASEASCAGMVLLSRTQLVGEDQAKKVKAHIEKAMTKSKVERKAPPIFKGGNWFDYTEDDFGEIAGCGYEMAAFEKMIAGEKQSYSSVYFLDIPMTTELIKEKIHILMNDSKFGDVFRLKGFYQENDTWYQVNATRRDIDIKPLNLGQQVIIVIGENLNKEEIEKEMNSNGYGAGGF